MKNDYNAENVVKFINDFVKHEEYFDRNFFEKLSCNIRAYMLYLMRT